MALGDGTTWDETLPTDGTNAVQIDDYNRDLRKGFRSRFALEHEMPTSQSATSEGGKHKYITMQEQGTKPTISGTQKSALYTDTNNNLIFEKSAGTVVTVVSDTAVGDGKVLANATDAAASYISDKLDSAHLTLSGTNMQVAPAVLDFADYGTSLTTINTSGLNKTIIRCGIATMVSGTAVVSNLPFANANYGLGITRFAAGDISQGLQISSKASSSFKIRDSQNTSNAVQWIAIGI